MLVHCWSGRYLEHGWRSRSGERRRPCGEGWHEHLRGGWSVAERGVRANAVVVSAPALDHDLRLLQRVEDLAIQQLVAKPGIEAFHIAVFPGRAPLNVRRLGPHSR